jgi:transglutaminase-like putative cysteine protease
MLIRAGYDISFEADVPTHMLALLSIHPSRNKDLVTPHRVVTSPAIPIYDYPDVFGNVRSRLTIPPGGVTLSCEFTVRDSGEFEPVVPELPDDVLIYLLGSRYCDTDRLSDMAWAMFADETPGWATVQAIVDFVHGHIRFDYAHARSTRTAWDAYQEQVGVCRDYAHLAITLCRCMNIPARYCTGYLGDIGVPAADIPTDFTAWMEVYLGGGWHVLDARHNTPRIGRIVMAKGLDAAHAALTTSFGNAMLTNFFVHTEEAK